VKRIVHGVCFLKHCWYQRISACAIWAVYRWE